MTKTGKSYESKIPVLNRAEDRLRAMLESTVAMIEDKSLVRAEVRGARIQGLAGLRRKAQENGWEADEAVSRCRDLVVCNNVDDLWKKGERIDLEGHTVPLRVPFSFRFAHLGFMAVY